MVFHSATVHQLGREGDEKTIEFWVDETGVITDIEKRWERRRKTGPTAAGGGPVADG